MKKIATRALVAALLACGLVRAANPVNLDWMAGHWCGDKDGRSSEEFWLPAKGGLMLGINRSVSAKGAGFEFLRIEVGERVRYIAQPGGAPPTAFDLVSSGPGTVTFANPAHDYPKRVHYLRDGNTLVAKTDGGAGDAQPDTFRWTKCQ
jgi:hypothetical protein